LEAHVQSRTVKKDYFWTPQSPSQEIQIAGSGAFPSYSKQDQPAIIQATDGLYVATRRLYTDRKDPFDRRITTQTIFKTDNNNQALQLVSVHINVLSLWADDFFLEQTDISELEHVIDSSPKADMPVEKILFTREYAGLKPLKNIGPGKKSVLTLAEYQQLQEEQSQRKKAQEPEFEALAPGRWRLLPKLFGF